jgi:molybdate transport system substrate-binding protein
VRARYLPTLLLFLAVTGSGGCSPGGENGAGGSESDPPLLVFAASDLRDAFESLIPRFEGETGIRIDLVLGSTGNLTSQIENGAPADLFLAANESFLDRLERGGLLEPGTRRVYARGRLALVWSDSSAPPEGLVEALEWASTRTLALANPEHAPYGTAAREVLERLGIWMALTPRMVLGENVAQALQFVETGNADLGLVALSLVQEGRTRPHLLVADSLHRPLRQAAGVVRGSRAPEEARRLLDWILSPEGQTILRRYGFEAPVP